MIEWKGEDQELQRLSHRLLVLVSAVEFGEVDQSTARDVIKGSAATENDEYRCDGVVIDEPYRYTSR